MEFVIFVRWCANQIQIQSIIVVIHVLLIFFCITPTGKKRRKRLLITNNKKAIKLQNGKKSIKRPKKIIKKQLITKNLYISKLQHSWAK